VYEETLTGQPHDTSVQKATSDNENVDAVQRHAQDKYYSMKLRRLHSEAKRLMTSSRYVWMEV